MQERVLALYAHTPSLFSNKNNTLNPVNLIETARVQQSEDFFLIAKLLY